MQTALLCAEEDDLELVGLVHRARQRGLELQVVSGVDASEEPMLFAMQRINPGLFVLVRTENLDADRARDLKARFLEMRVSDQHLLALKLDPDRLDDTVEGIERRLERMSQGSEEDSTASMRASRDSLDPMFTPVHERTELGDPEVTERQDVARSGEEETTRSIQYYPAGGPRRRPGRRIAKIVTAVTVAAVVSAAGYFGYQTFVAAPSPQVESSTADEPEAEPAFEESEVQVPTVEEDDDPTSPPTKPQLRRRTMPRSGI